MTNSTQEKPRIIYAWEQIGFKNYVVRPVGALGTHGFIGGVGWEAEFCSSQRQAEDWVKRKNGSTT